jgi:tetratricopeptide (TPR) repeat protein
LETVLPPDHPDLASVWTNLGALYTAQARYRSAESMLQKALAHHVRVLGPNDVANYGTLKGYANLLRLTKRKAEAGSMELRAREVASRNEQLSFIPYVVDAAQLKRNSIGQRLFILELLKAEDPGHSVGERYGWTVTAGEQPFLTIDRDGSAKL